MTTSRAIRTPSRRHRDDRGAALVEMAIILPLFFALIFGMIDFGYAFTKTLDVRHGAREIGRLAAVNYDAPGNGVRGQEIVNEGCTRMDGSASTSVTLLISSDGSSVTVTVTQAFRSLTGFYRTFLPTTLTSRITMKTEQTPTFGIAGTPATYVCGVAA